MNPGEHLGIWLAIATASAGLAAWNISRLRIVRPAIDRLVAVIGGAAILMVVVGASLVITEVTECTFAVSSLACTTEILLVALLDLLASAALITLWLRSDACHRTPVIARARR